MLKSSKLFRRAAFASWLIVVAAVLAGTATTARASTVVCVPGCSYPYQRWVDRAKVPTPEVVVTIYEGICPNGVETKEIGCATADSIWLGPPVIRGGRGFGWQGAKEVFLHELGHVFDFTSLTEAGRRRYMSIFRLGGPWYPWSAAHYWRPGEWFAESYAYCAQYPIWEVREEAPREARACWLIRNQPS